jgi:diacylglycerol kinase
LKSKLYRFLIFCAGSDEDILARCPRSEHIKHAGFGALVLVPATLGLFSMTYAISTFAESPYLYVLAGLVWAAIVFTFDRFVISTFRKKSSIAKDALSVTFLSRLVFSIFVGIAVAHPLVLLYFHESIAVNMDEVAHAKVDSIENVYQLQRKNYQLQTDTLDNNLKALNDTIHLQERILHDEIKGIVRGDDRTTGKAGEGPTFKYDTAYLNRLYFDAAQAKRSNEAKKLENSIAITKLDSARNSKIERLTFSRDYLEREKALQRLSDTNPIIRVTTGFLILFFILVDILPVTWKGLTSKGPYDEYLNEIEFKIKNEVQERMMDSETHLVIHARNKEKEKAFDEVVT